MNDFFPTKIIFTAPA